MKDINKVPKLTPELESRMILLTYHGSRSYGTEVENSDVDMFGIVAPPVEDFFGLYHKDTWTGEAPMDYWAYSIEKFFRLALKANPNVLQVFFQNESLRETWHWKYIKKKRKIFLGQVPIRKAFLGFARSQFKKLETGTTKDLGERRKKLIDEFGYDVRGASHLVRLLYQLGELLWEGRLTLPMPESQREFVLQVKQGELPLKEVLHWASMAMEKYSDLRNIWSSLPMYSDEKAANELLQYINRAIYMQGQGRI